MEYLDGISLRDIMTNEQDRIARALGKKNGEELQFSIAKRIKEHFENGGGDADGGAQMRLLGIKDRRQLKEDQRKHREGLATHNRKFVHFFLYEKGKEEVIGWCGYHTWYTDHHRAELGYAFFSDDPKWEGDSEF